MNGMDCQYVNVGLNSNRVDASMIRKGDRYYISSLSKMSPRSRAIWSIGDIAIITHIDPSFGYRFQKEDNNRLYFWLKEHEVKDIFQLQVSNSGVIRQS